jgi:hypothetical protein
MLSYRHPTHNKKIVKRKKGTEAADGRYKRQLRFTTYEACTKPECSVSVSLPGVRARSLEFGFGFECSHFQLINKRECK